MALFCLVAALYGRTASFHFVDWDDRHHVYANPAVVDPAAAHPLDRWLGRNIGYPLPLTLATWRLDRALYGPETLDAVRPAQGQGYHRTQLLWIFGFALALYGLGSVSIAPGWPAALFAGLVVAHPVAAEPLAWITGRKDLFVGIFAALTLLSLWRARVSDSARWWWLATGFAVLAMASKPTGVCLAGFAVWAVTVGRPRGHRPASAAWVLVAALCGLAAVIIVVGSAWHLQLGGLETATPADTPGARLLRSLHATSWHLRMLAAPAWLRAKYVIETPTTFGVTELATAAVGAMTVGISWRWRHHVAGWAAAFALFAWLPVSNLVPLRRHVADSYMLLPWVALCWGVLGSIASRPAPPARSGRPQALPRPVLLVATGALLVLSLRAAPQIETWRDSVQLWKQTLRYEKDSPQVCRMAGHGLFFEGERHKALAMWEACAARFGPALFANNLAIAALQVGERDKARRWFQWILARRPNDQRAQRHLRALRSGRDDAGR